MSDMRLIRCPSCGATNRVPPEKLGQGLQPVCGRCKSPLLADSKPVTVTDATFSAEVERSPLPVLLDLWAPWCGPCRAIAPIVDELAGEYAGKLKVVKLNVADNPRTPTRYGVRGIPYLILFKNGALQQQIVGAVPNAHLIK